MHTYHITTRVYYYSFIFTCFRAPTVMVHTTMAMVTTTILLKNILFLILNPLAIGNYLYDVYDEKLKSLRSINVLINHISVNNCKFIVKIKKIIYIYYLRLIILYTHTYYTIHICIVRLLVNILCIRIILINNIGSRYSYCTKYNSHFM